jgi:alkanesulfonate monooxygenase SsuD/methylene tetrahydromethanopterin reductase-like flavin-dependent oxidoreductase (luciferase family)
MQDVKGCADVICTCHYTKAEFCRHHGPLLKAQPAVGGAPPASELVGLRDIARDARWILTGHAVSEEARADLLARIDAALAVHGRRP